MSSNTTLLLTAIISAILGPILVKLISFLLEKRKSKSDMVTEALITSERVSNKLEQIKQEFHADRVWVAQFHNGGHFYPTGKSIAKFSIVYEIVGSETPSIQSNFQNIPVSLFSKPINHLLDSNIISIPDFKDETVATYGLKYIAGEAESKSTYMLAIKTIDDKFIGTLCISYTKRKTKLTEEQVLQLLNHATAIGGVLNVQLHSR